MAIDWSYAFQNLSITVYESGLLVFLLVFVLVYATLQKTKILGDMEGQGRKFNLVIALIMGLLVIVPHYTGYYPVGMDVVDIINAALPQISLLAVAGIMLLLLIGIFGAEKTWMGAPLSGWISILAFIFVAVIFASQVGWTGFYISDYIDDDTLTVLIVLAVFGILVNFIVSDPGKQKEVGRGMKLFKDIGNAFGGKPE